MIQLFRRFFQSKIGIGVTLAFLALIAVAFASSDVANNSLFGGVAGGDRVANVGDQTLTTADLIQNANSAVQQSRAENPTITMESFIADGGLDDVLEQMLTRAAISEFGKAMGLRASQATVNSELRATGIFNGLNGEFDPEVFRTWVRQQGLTEDRVLEDVAMGIQAEQLLMPISYGMTVPDSIARRYAGMFNETRVGLAAGFTAVAFAPDEDPTDEQLETYYQANRGAYVRPERRVIRYATFDRTALDDIAPVTDEQIARRYERDAAVYAPIETRSFTQLVLPTQAAAQAVIDEVNGGVSLEASAREKGLQTVTLSGVSREDIEEQASENVADAAFAAQSGDLARPARGNLGWYVLRVDQVTQNSGQTLEQASEGIRQQLFEERQQLALNEFTERLEDEFRNGRSLTEAAEELGLEVTTSRQATATGQVYGTQESVAPQVARIIPFAFQVDAGDPQLNELVPGEQYLIFDVSEVVPSAAAPLAEIRDDVVTAWRREQGMAEAGAAAARVIERIEGGATFAEAVAAEEVSLPAPEPLRLNRRELAEQGQLSLASILFFSMAEGSTKPVELADVSTWFVVQLSEIEQPEIDAEDQRFAETRQQLVASLGEEYVVQFVTAMQGSLEAETNEVAVEAVRAQLLGLNN
ncbi:peptidyl-prolyl cis-trans isomerase [Aurantiacibacter gilvus]|uniref:Parvulin-like PPIase n=1 Tax=Aurantiacibacter gilvus TaxID=3139141 RepID=A0ABU9ICQ9_9SPHN